MVRRSDCASLGSGARRLRLSPSIAWLWRLKTLHKLGRTSDPAGSLGVAILCAGVDLGAVSFAVTLIAVYLSFSQVLYIQGRSDGERDLLRDISNR